MKNSSFKSSQDFRKSLEVRLQKGAKEKGIDLQRIRRQVAFDRLLARFFAQPETPFFLKGGYAMELRLSSARATRDKGQRSDRYPASNENARFRFGKTEYESPKNF